MSELVRSEVGSDGVASVVIDRPDKKNALSTDVRDRISDTLDHLAEDVSVRAVVLTGAGDVFSAGFDLDEFQIEDPDFVDRLWVSSDRFHQTVLRFPLPLVAAVNGPAIAGGFDLAVMCDLRVAADSAWFSHPERLFAEVVYSPLHDLVGGAVARELVLTGRRVGAAEALALHLVTAVVPVDRVLPESTALAATIAEAPRENLLRTKAKIIRRAKVATGATLDL